MILSMRIPPLTLTLWLLLSILAGAERSRAEADSRPPNIILILTDDQGFGDWQRRDPRIQTPALMRLAAEGFELTNFHATLACSPTRAALLTGRHGARTGVLGLMTEGRSMGRDERTIAQLLGAAGYRTGLVGKWHLSERPGSVSTLR